jgi:hypothetical protein
MRRLLPLLAALALALAIAGPVLAADEDALSGRVIFVAGGDIAVPAGEEATLVVIAQGHADVAGTVETLVVLDGSATTAGDALLGSVTVINSTLELASGTTVSGDVSQLNSTIDRADGVVIGGSVTDLAAGAAAFGLFLGFASLVLWVGFGVATLLVGLVVAALAARQVRRTTAYMGSQPGTTFLVGLLAAIVVPLIAVLAFLTIVGIPTGFALLVVVWPAAGFAGYLVAAIWIGEWLVNRGRAAPPERPYLAAVVGIVIVTILGFVPLLTTILSVFGLGAVVRAAWSTARGVAAPAQAQTPDWSPT